MAAHLEAVPGAKAVISFAPILLEQIADYDEQVRGYLKNGGAIRDPLLAALADPVLPSIVEQRVALRKTCLRANKNNLIKRFPSYHALAELAAVFSQHQDTMHYVEDQYVVDLLVWYHLAWLGETVRRQDVRVQALIRKGKNFTLHDRRQLLAIIGELLSGIVGRYAALAARGQVELAVSPYAHPIVPLLLDLQCARETLPEAPLPALRHYLGGEARVRWHLQAALDCFQRHFDLSPQGCWPSEGGVSAATFKLLSEFGFRWAASGESVLRNSLAHDASGTRQRGEGLYLYRPYEVAGSSTICFFRDDGLSDLIGFTYSDWHAEDAVANLTHHLENIAHAWRERPGSVVSIILDGENAWEYYPENGYHFLTALYQRLTEHPQLELTTFSRCMDHSVPRGQLPQLVPGSWVYGTFSTWIGEPDKNRGWEMLGDAKQAFDAAVSQGLAGEALAAAERQLAVCEGSDWFWWFGADNPEDTVSDFDQLYRMHLSNLYQLLGREPPEYLAHVFTHGGGAPKHGGTMRPGQAPG
jgi:alpha-amylase/alpha-mannosidase (GH57 family)